MKQVPLSVVVITKNEEKNLAVCLESVHNWAEEIIVVDDMSTDSTVSIAQKYADKVFERKMDTEGTHRNWAYAQASKEWVLSLDADEYVTAELREEIENILPDTEWDGFAIPRKNFIGDYWVRHGGQYPANQLRLFKKQCFRYEEVEVHPRVFFEGKTTNLHKDIVHKSYRDFAHFLSKLNNQTTLEARKWVMTGRQMSFGKALWRTFDRFPRTYLRKKGYKDGFYGFMVSFFASIYQIISYAKYWEMKNRVEKK